MTTPALAPPPLLVALCQLAVAVLARRPGGKIRVHGIAPTPDGLAIEADINMLGPLLGGRYRIEATILRTGKESTLCEVRIVEGRAAGRLLGWGLRLLPKSLLNGLLGGQAGGALQWEGDRMRIDHAALAQWLTRR